MAEIYKGVIMNTIREFIEFRKNGLRIVLLAFIFSILTSYLSIQSMKYISKLLYMLSAIMFFIGAVYILFYFIIDYIKSKK